MSERVVLCFGDSNTYGSVPGESGGRFPREVRWPGVLARELGDGWRVVEEGLPGRTTVFDDPLEPHRRGSDYLPPCLASHSPLDLVVIFLGTNDLKARFAAEPSDIAAGVGVLVRRTLASGCGPGGAAPRVLVLGLPRLAPVAWPDFAGAEEKAARLAPFLEQTAREHGVDVLDLGAVALYAAADGIHLDEAGHETVGETVTARVRRMF